MPGAAAQLREPQAVALQTGLLAAGVESLRLELGGESRELRRTHFERRADSFSWRGEFAGSAGSLALFTTRGGVTSGLLLDGGRTWRLVPAGDGTHVLGKVDGDRFRPCGARGEGGGHLLAQAAPAGAGAGGPAQLDILALYTAEAQTRAGGRAAIETLIEQAVDLANVAFDNSGVAARARLVGIAPYGRAEIGDARDDLEALTGDAEVEERRRAAGADVVSLFVAEGGEYCGFAWYYDGPESGFNVTEASCALDFLIYPHELAHNLGADHNPENAKQPAPARDSYFSGEYRTLMSYPDPCGQPCPPVAYFSSPAVHYGGHPTGVAGLQDNVTVINAHAAAVADYFSAPAGGAGCTPSPTKLCLGNGRFAVDVAWRTPQGQKGAGQGGKLTDRSGYFWFFDADNVELTLKVLDACSAYGRYWVFLSGMTNVAVTVDVRDTLSGVERTYRNDAGKVFQSVQDTDAFATCP